MIQEIIFTETAREKIKNGVDQLANAVKVTLGPKGRNVILQRKYGLPIVTKDGITVAKEIHLPDKFEDIGAQMVKEVASRTNELAGDGTTTATVLAQAIYNYGIKHIIAKANPMDLKRGIDYATAKAVDYITSISRTIQNDEQLAQVALISANQDHEIASVVTEAILGTAGNGKVSVTNSQTDKTYVDQIGGFTIDRGYLSPYFVTDAEKGIVEYAEPWILVYEGDISAIKPLTPILKKAAEEKKPLLIIANKIEGDALGVMVINNVKGTLQSCGVLSPGFSHRRPELLQDLALSIGATVIGSTQSGISLENCTSLHLGNADKVTVTQGETIIINGKRGKGYEERVKLLENKLKACTDEFEKEHLESRIANLVGSISVIYVGANNEIEAREKKDRIEDALNATRAAREEGIIPGGGVAYLKARLHIPVPHDANEDFKSGIKLLSEALRVPIMQIAQNGGVEGEVVIHKIIDKSKGDRNLGFDAQTGKYVNMLEAGIIDTTKVARVALENAASIAGLLLTTECLIASDSEEMSQMTF